MKKILVIGGSNSSKSINKIFATHIAHQLDNSELTIFDWENFVLPLYSPDLEAEKGIPENANKFINLVAESDAVVLSLAEHNSLHPAAFKNLWDWASRLEVKLWANKPMFLAATSPGGRGGASVLKITKEIIPHYGGNVITDFSLPKFYDNFKDGGITNPELENDLNHKIHLFQQSI